MYSGNSLHRTHVIEIESFINIHKVYRENRKVLNKRWLDESLTRQKNLLSEINLKRMGPEVYEKIQKTEKLTFLKSLDSIKPRFVDSRFFEKAAHDLRIR
ncbi:toxin-antitoxin system, toxin component, PIN family [Leptospira santarosai str. CBC523]|nr:toxin-antitoxin system, toxin component, PIN family [Leptospira santarosai str. CBC523]